MRARDLEIGDWFMLVVAMHRESDQRDCRSRGGTVEHYDPKDYNDWRCVGGAVER